MRHQDDDMHSAMMMQIATVKMLQMITMWKIEVMVLMTMGPW